MLKRSSWQRRLFGLFVAVVILIVGPSPPLQECIKQAHGGGTGQSTKEQIANFLSALWADRACFASFLHENGEAVIALFTIILGFATWFLWRATRDLVDGAEAATEHQLRAYVMPDGIDPRIGNNGVTITFSVRNFGRTPAANVSVWMEVGITPETVPSVPDEIPEATFSLGPNAEFEFVRARQETAALFDEIRGGKRTVFFRGRLVYVDAFGQKRWTDIGGTVVYMRGNWFAQATEENNGYT